MDKLLGYALGIAIVLIALLGWGLKGSLERNGALEGALKTATEAASRAEKQRKSDSALLTRRQGEIASQRLQSATLTEALKRAQEGADRPAGALTPPAVREALEGAVEGLQ